MNDWDDENTDGDPTPTPLAVTDVTSFSSFSPKREDKNKSHEANTCECISDMALLTSAEDDDPSPSSSALLMQAERRSAKLSMISRESLTVVDESPLLAAMKKPC
mmetsp:Transcript_12444/g.18768  ORF Transcript_12444/g.18768 Transcript_12444/m.18768 type:complete len:105 (+) Transcript_12444:239-553(+)